MNAATLRFRLSRLLNREPGIREVTMNSPSPDRPLVLTVTVNDPYSTSPSARTERRYKITIEEID